MSEYEKRIFETLTSTDEKFISALEIANQVDSIKRRLIIDYWKRVKNHLETLIKENGENFKVELEKDVFKSNSKCYLFLENTRNVRVMFRQLATKQQFGIWIHKDNTDISIINNYREKVISEFNGWSSNNWWLALKYIEDDFSIPDSLLRILPNNVDEHSKQQAEKLFDFAVANKEHLKYIINNCLK